ncbi:SHOCT-like domain-containing protein [Calidithermus roseus]|uniref:YvlB/LiaX N-terminal domain-containing protein n=1 Tax=Calidithermus roseus TaxID=1644118 RepID=A0A399EKF3_9DEIN|nr:hypothetical protein [Calidithermus roseus]RIH83840.1 hypothetical protein Mrose_02870 [Calidithermus roseus]
MEDKRRIMDMVKEGKISVEEAVRLLEAIEPQAASPRTPGTVAVAVPPAPPAPLAKGIAKMLRISVNGEGIKVNVNVPVSLAKFAASFIPPEAKQAMSAQGIDVAGILDMLKGDLPEGRLVDVEIQDMAQFTGDEGQRSPLKGTMRVVIEVI